MLEALELAREAGAAGEVPVGAVVVCGDRVVGRGANRRETTGDPLAHAELLAHVRGQGRVRGAHDLLIAATARTRTRTVVTADAAGFDGLPGVRVRVLGGGE